MLIDVKHIKNSSNMVDDYLDILVSPADSCAKFTRTFFNNLTSSNGYKSYDEVFTNLWNEIADYYQDLQDNMEESTTEVTDVVGDVGNSMNSTLIQDALKQTRNPQSILNNISVGNPLNLSANLNMSFADDALDKVSEAFDTALQGLCQ